jgi:hypothetical protein
LVGYTECKSEARYNIFLKSGSFHVKIFLKSQATLHLPKSGETVSFLTLITGNQPNKQSIGLPVRFYPRNIYFCIAIKGQI